MQHTEAGCAQKWGQCFRKKQHIFTMFAAAFNPPPSLQRMRDGSETSSWLNANTKPCPKCSKPVEKNGGWVPGCFEGY